MVQEIDWSVAGLKLGKVPGLAGLTAEFYKAFKDQLTPYLYELFNYCIKVGRIPTTWKEARLTLILKEGKEEMYPVSYHPIALLNVDYKILSSIMVERLNEIIGCYVRQDQVGFITGRFI